MTATLTLAAINAGRDEIFVDSANREYRVRYCVGKIGYALSGDKTHLLCGKIPLVGEFSGRETKPRSLCITEQTKRNGGRGEINAMELVTADVADITCKTCLQTVERLRRYAK